MVSKDNLSSPPFALLTYMTSFYKIRRYKAKSLDHEIYVILNKYRKYDTFIISSYLILSQIQGKITGYEVTRSVKQTSTQGKM